MMLSATTSAAAFAIGWIMFCSLLHQRFAFTDWTNLTLVSLGGITIISMMVRPFRVIFQKLPAIAAAMELEAAHPQFDQRLITLASVDHSDPLADCLAGELDSLIQNGKVPAHVSLRPIRIPALALLVMFVLWVTVPRCTRSAWFDSRPRLAQPVLDNSKINSISTLASSGSVFTPTAART